MNISCEIYKIKLSKYIYIQYTNYKTLNNLDDMII